MNVEKLEQLLNRRLSSVEMNRARRFDAWLQANMSRPANAPPVSHVVGPVEAAVVLCYSWGNRRENTDHINAIAAAMKIGERADGFIRTHQSLSIAFLGTQRFADGHHRMYAVIKSGVNLEFQFSFGLRDEALLAIDAEARPRNVRDVTKLAHNRDVSNKDAATIRSYARITGYVTDREKFSATVLNKLYDLNEESLAALGPLIKRKFAACFWGAMLLGHNAFPAETLAFASMVVDGHNLEPNSPAYALREFMFRANTAGADNAKDIERKVLIALRAHIEGRALSRLTYKDEDRIVHWFTSRSRIFEVAAE